MDDRFVVVIKRFKFSDSIVTVDSHSVVFESAIWDAKNSKGHGCFAIDDGTPFQASELWPGIAARYRHWQSDDERNVGDCVRPGR